MRQTITTLVTIMLVASTVATLPLAGATTQSTNAQVNANGVAVADRAANETTNGSANVTPGGQLMGVLGVQQSELNGTIADKAFGLKVAQAATSESKAEVVAEQVGDLQERLADLSERKQELREARQNGSISEAEYRAEMAELAAETQAVKRLANATENASGGLPESLLAEKGINGSAIQTLQASAANLTGPEVAAIAQSIAGPSVGSDIADERRPDDRGQGRDGAGSERGANETATGNETTTPGGNDTGNETTGGGDDTTTAPGNGGGGSGNDDNGSDSSGGR
jgi:hypothetical protein